MSITDTSVFHTCSGGPFHCSHKQKNFSYKQQSFYVWVSHQRKPDQWADEQQRQIYCLDRASSCDLSSLSDFPLPRAPRSPPVKSETTSPSQPKVGLCSCVDIIQLALYSPTSCMNHFLCRSCSSSAFPLWLYKKGSLWWPLILKYKLVLCIAVRIQSARQPDMNLLYLNRPPVLTQDRSSIFSA